MLTHGFIKNIDRIHKEKKYRSDRGVFIVEGEKSILELFNSDFIIETIFTTKDFYEKYKDLLKDRRIDCHKVDQPELEKISSFKANDGALAIVKQKKPIEFEVNSNEIVLALDDIRDPGNLGTIIRLADWYGIKKIIASIGTADFYNSKTIAATMGSFTRVSIKYTELAAVFSKSNFPILGTYLKGKNVHTFSFPKNGVLLIGNEANGINKNIEKFVTEKITIPSYGKAESLNASIATAITLDNWKRNLN